MTRCDSTKTYSSAASQHPPEREVLIGPEVRLAGSCDPLCKNETTPIGDRRSGRRSSVAPEALRPDEVHVA